MGKHERQSIKEAEKIIVKVLNFKKLDSSDRKNRWFKHAFFIAKKIKKDFTKITFSKHLGDRYDNTGDIFIVSNGKEILIEVKMSDTKLGTGTKANISQDALTENHLFVGQVKNWSQFRRKQGYDKWVNNYLDQFTKYPQKISKITNLINRKEEKARYLRGLAGRGNKEAYGILKNIQEKDRKEKIEYLVYLSKKKQNEELVKRFFILIILGIHKKEELGSLIKKENFFKEVQNLFVYYGNLSSGVVTVRQENAGDRIKKIIKQYDTFRIVFPSSLTHCKIVGMKNTKIEPLLQIVLHWKNIAQGIKTPCLNIFDLTA